MTDERDLDDDEFLLPLRSEATCVVPEDDTDDE